MSLESLGFIGTGTISSAIVTGLCTGPEPPMPIWLSPRSEQTAHTLARSYGNVHVAGSNQDVLDRVETVVLAVLPAVAIAVIEALTFRHTQRVISLIAGLHLESLRSMIRPAIHCSRAVPLPTVALQYGPIAIFPPDAATAALFRRIGETVEVEDQGHFEALLACTAGMASFFKVLAVYADFLSQSGLRDAQARRYVSTLFGALGKSAIHANDRTFDELAKEHTTPGGLNEQMINELTAEDVFATHAAGLGHILNRLRRSERLSGTEGR